MSRVRKNFSLRDLVTIYDEAQESLIQVSKFFGLKSITDEYSVPILYAKPYLGSFRRRGHGFFAPVAGLSCRQAAPGNLPRPRAKDEASRGRLLSENRSAAFYFGKIASARFFTNQVLTLAPEGYGE